MLATGVSSAKHEHERPKPEPSRPQVVIGFSTPTRFNVLSWAIRKITGSRASHAWLGVVDPLFRLEMVMEAHTTGMRLVPRALFATTNRVVAVARPQGDFSAALAGAGKCLGEKYDLGGLFGMAFVLVARWLRLKARNPFNDTNALFCSEAVVQVLKAARYPGSERLEPECTSPEDLLEFLQDNAIACPIDFVDDGLAQRRRRRRTRRHPDAPPPASLHLPGA